ncbi:proteasome assembly chaperone 4 family protein [Aspergillus undulatus]|uniref:proteasome assembly chaperone 4 family protein n=1 Tax=Aspergillus undulatus TaxID=1810928 RepID=UPI003CCE53F4
MADVQQPPSQAHPIELSFPLPKTLYATAHIHLTMLETCAMVFLATSTPGDSSGSVKPMGSFIYAMPDRTSPRSAISTTLYTSASTEEYATRIAKILARRMGAPVYLGCSIDPVALGLLPEEEMEGLTGIVDKVMMKWDERKR